MTDNKEADTSYDGLIDKALQNAIEDREKASEAFDKTKSIYDIEVDNAESLQGLMLIGQNASKLLEISSKANEQIIKLAQIREKEESRIAERSNKESGRLDMNQINKFFAEQDKK